MKLSALLAETPQLDPEIDLEGGDLLLDGVYLFRVIKPEHEPGESTIHVATSDHTDGIVKTGLLSIANDIARGGWVHSDEEDA